MKLLNKIMLSMVATGAVMASSASFAQSSNDAQTSPRYSAYNYGSIGITNHDGGDSIIAQGSYEFSSPYYVSGYYRNFDSDTAGSNDAFGIKLARYFWLSQGLTADLGVRAGNVDWGPVDSSFWGVEGILRQRIDQFEVYAGAGWVDYSDAGTDNQYQVGVNYYLQNNLSVGVGYQDDEFGDGLRLRASYHF
ncbi:MULTISPECIES: hypothetical protein [Pseudidiomarina]|uniref:Outer membrane protein beta-barrel domain-containing protein n=2 Tax=Pseudidiomarina TaxID=2800384 RepID=A0A368UZS0_9GAMM|nr:MULTISPECIES: hypothetical protein [Pseudidiomarina]PWW14519.1 hypothetical protein DET45_103212 [Pseudidiomarina maritima]RBP92481.1 hypothetical protein DFO81_10230 [Pseudidiomarina tainanensis]RCW34289.1 hypothetical protein DFO79_10330 [Pseudidiomarina tainanensis]